MFISPDLLWSIHGRLEYSQQRSSSICTLQAATLPATKRCLLIFYHIRRHRLHLHNSFDLRSWSSRSKSKLLSNTRLKNNMLYPRFYAERKLRSLFALWSKSCSHCC